MLSKEKIKEFKKRLEKDKIEIEKSIKKLEIPPDMGDEPGPEDEISEMEGYYNQKSSAMALREKLADIESALIKMDKGEYGVCEATGKEIPVSVLDVIPEARFHPDYQKKKNK
jgi:DnaK suppressor protein